LIKLHQNTAEKQV